MTHRREQIATLEVDKGAGDDAAVIVTTFPDQRRICPGRSSLVDHLREALARL
jgi:hypothetical protein